MLQAALDNSSLQTWNIYQDRDGSINFKLKFRSHDTEPAMHVNNIGYRKKSYKHMQRDQDRSRAWQAQKDYKSHSTHHPMEPTTVKSDSVGVGVKTRSMAKEAIEVPRCDPKSPLNPFADSFAMPVNTPPQPFPHTHAYVFLTQASKYRSCVFTGVTDNA